MADKTINVKIKEAYDTEANQKSKNPVLLKGQMAISSDKRKAKVGDGTSTQQNLSYMNAESANSASTATKATQDASGNVITSTYATKTELGGKADKSHTHTKDQVGLGNVDNTADANKTVAAAKKIAGMEQGTADVDRIVQFADTAGKEKPAWDDDFKYNPAKNTLTVPNIKSNLYGNVSGNVYSKNVTGTLQSKVIMLPDVPYDLIEPTHTTEKYLKELLKQICSNYPDEGGTAVFIGTANPNSRGPVEIHIYQTSDVNSDGYPRYASGQYQSLNRDLVLFGFHNFDQYYGCPEQAKNAENANTAKSISTVSNRPASANLNYGDGKLRYFIATSSMSTGKPTFNGTAHDAQIIDLPWDNTGGFDSQVAVSNVTGQLSVRSQDGGKWQPWHSVYDEGHKPSKSDVGLSKVDNTSDADKPISKATQTALDKKVDKVAGKGLSTNDFTTVYKNKLDGIESGAQKNTVTGVKGNSESNYRTGNINLTADNVGAVSKAGSMMNRKATIQQGNNEDWSKDDPKQTYPVKLGGLCQHEQSDTIDIYAEERARDQLDLVIQLGDDDSNHISIRNHSGSQTAYITPQGEFGGSFKGSLNGQLNSPYDNNLISHGNEFNFEPKFDQDHDVYINYRTQSPNDYKIMKYRFIDGSNAHGYADIQAKTFIGTLSGNASTASQWETARSFTIKDATSTNAGTSASVSGNANVDLLLPSTIKANLTGHASSDLAISGGTMTGTLVLARGDKKGIKIGSSYLSAQSETNGEQVLQGGHLRFGTSSQDYSQWAGLKYDHDKKSIYLGLADGTIFTANGNPQSNGLLLTPGISEIHVGDNLKSNLVLHTGNYRDYALALTGGTLTGTLKVNNTDGLKINSNSKDLKIWEVLDDNSNQSSTQGFYEKYNGSKSDNDNSLELVADNRTGSHITVRTIKQDGTVTWNTKSTFNGGANFGNAVTFANNTQNPVGDDVEIGNFNKSGTLAIRGANGTTAIGLVPKGGNNTNYAEISYDGSIMHINKPTTIATEAENSNNTRIATTEYADRAVKNLKIGGRNLIKGAAGENEISLEFPVSSTSTYADYSFVTESICNEGTYVLSFEAKVNATGHPPLESFFYSPNTTTSSKPSQGTGGSGSDGHTLQGQLTTEWKKYYVVQTQTKANKVKSVIVARRQNHASTKYILYIRNVKFEAGDVPTDQTPAFEEYYTKNEIDEKNSKTASVKILASKQSSSAPYTQTVTVNGITSASLPIPMLDTRSCTDVNNEKTVKREYGYLTYFETSTNQIKIYAKFQKPTVDLTVVFKGV